MIRIKPFKPTLGVNVKIVHCLLSTNSIILSEWRQRINENYNQTKSIIKGTILDQMAKRMNPKDAEMLANQWGYTRESVSLGSVVNNSILSNDKSKADETNIVDEQPKSESFAKFKWTNSNANNIFHPIFGELLCDLGYKRLYLTNVRSLAIAPVWKKQRILRPERANLIANDKIKHGRESSLCGTIIMYLNENHPEDFGIIDGQHRAGALLLLAEKGHWNPSTRNILVEVFVTKEDSDVMKIFREINSAEPVRMIDMMDIMYDYPPVESGETALIEEDLASSNMLETGNDSNLTIVDHIPEENTQSAVMDHEIQPIQDDPPEVEGIKPKKKKLPVNDESKAIANLQKFKLFIDAATESLQRKYPEMFKPTSRCRPPHVNIDILRDEIFQSETLSKKRFGSVESMIELLEKLNQKMGKKIEINILLAKKQLESSDSSDKDGMNEKKKTKKDQDDEEEADDLSKHLEKSYQIAYKKAKSNNFYLGLDKSWLH